MSDLWERVKKTAAEIYTTASEKTVEGINIGAKHLDVASYKREISREFTGLGGRVHQLLIRDEAGAIADDATVKHHMTRLAELEQKVEEREAEIEELKKSGGEPAETGSDPQAVETSAAARTPGAQPAPGPGAAPGSAPAGDGPSAAPAPDQPKES